MKIAALELKDINKYMSEDFTLSNINFDVFYGEVHAIMGENGSGKSLTIKIISGIFKKDSGSIFIDNKEISPDSVHEAKRLGIHSVFQEIALYPNLSVAENIYYDNMPIKNNMLHTLDFNKLYHDCSQLFNKLGISINPRAKVDSLAFAQKHFISMARSYISDAKIIIFDEPSAAFTEVEKTILFSVIKELKQKNKAIIYITHFVEELELIADRITVIYQGKIIGTKDLKEVNTQQIIRMMTATNSKKYPKLDIPIGKMIFKVNNLSFKNVLSNINFDLKKGEILGLTGLVGSGRSTLAKCLFGILPPSTGCIEINGVSYNFKDPNDAINSGLAFLPEDRVESSLFGRLNLEENISISSLKRFVKSFVIDPYILSNVSSTYVEKLSIKPGYSGDIINTYSGGNQQKMAVARWIMSRKLIYILDEPTRGVDIASKTDIYNCMVDMASKGASIIFISSDIDEILGMCDRIMVLTNGSLVCNLDKKQASKETILKYAAGSVV